jgi:predicted secreted Zn-dependent protease
MIMKRTSNSALKYLVAVCLLVLSCGSIQPASTPESGMVAPSSTLAPANIPAVDIPNANIVYYDISGSTEGELRTQLNTLGPVGYDGYKGDATTEWFIRWNWPGYGTSSCDLSAADISYDIKVIFPRWVPTKDISPDLIVKWANYTKLLAAHEKGHVDSVLENFPAIVNAIKGATCETADSVGNEFLDRIRQLDIDYDADTQHGATQGARFP